MKKALPTVLALWVAAVLGLASCSDDTVDAVVVFDMEPTPGQPWVASGELVDAGRICPSGDRQIVGLSFPDGTPMTIDQLVELYEAAWETGGSPQDVARIGLEEYVCDDGSGTFTVSEAFNGNPADPGTGEVVSGTGAYGGLTGTCTIVLTENQERTEVLEITGTCEFDMGSND